MKITIKEHPMGNAVGGKAAGLRALDKFHEEGVFRNILADMSSESRFRGASQSLVPLVPGAVVLTDGHFMSYVSKKEVRAALDSGDSAKIAQAMAETPISDSGTLSAIHEAASTFKQPIAVRSSASCEDSNRTSPFAGDFLTTFTTNQPELPEKERVAQVEQAVRQVYASMFREGVVAKMIRNNLDPQEHFMAVVLQRVVGDRISLSTSAGEHDAFFPMMSMVLASRAVGMKRPEGIGRDAPLARAGFGLGTLVVDSDVPCRVVFPDRPIFPIPFIAPSEGRYSRDDEVRTFLLGYQDRFDFIGLSSGRLERLGFSEILSPDFFPRFRGSFTGLDGSMSLSSLSSCLDSPRDFEIRATFKGFGESGLGKSAMEFLSRMARELRSRCGYDVDMELALAPIEGGSKLAVGLVQLRQFGIVSEGKVTLSEVPEERVIAKSGDCIGHGKLSFERLVLVSEEASEDIARAAAAVSSMDSKYGGEYAIMGPNITDDIGRGGVYAQLFNPGLIISYRKDGISMVHCLNHTFNNVAMQKVIEVVESEVSQSVRSILSSNPERIAPGVYVLEKPLAAELDDMTGRGQAYFK